jgi:hypothetical protein
MKAQKTIAAQMVTKCFEYQQGRSHVLECRPVSDVFEANGHNPAAVKRSRGTVFTFADGSIATSGAPHMGDLYLSKSDKSIRQLGPIIA